MEAMVLIGGFLYIAVVGYVVIDRLGRFLDKGGISPYWDEEEEHLAQMKKRSLLTQTFWSCRTFQSSRRIAIRPSPG